VSPDQGPAGSSLVQSMVRRAAWAQIGTGTLTGSLAFIKVGRQIIN